MNGLSLSVDWSILADSLKAASDGILMTTPLASLFLLRRLIIWHHNLVCNGAIIRFSQLSVPCVSVAMSDSRQRTSWNMKFRVVPPLENSVCAETFVRSVRRFFFLWLETTWCKIKWPGMFLLVLLCALCWPLNTLAAFYLKPDSGILKETAIGLKQGPWNGPFQISQEAEACALGTASGLVLFEGPR